MKKAKADKKIAEVADIESPTPHVKEAAPTKPVAINTTRPSGIPSISRDTPFPKGPLSFKDVIKLLKRGTRG